MRTRTPNRFSLIVILVIAICFAAITAKENNKNALISQHLGNGLFLQEGTTYTEPVFVGPLSPKIRVKLNSTGSLILQAGNIQQSCKTASCTLIFDPHVETDSFDLSITALSDAHISNAELDVIKYQQNTTLNKLSPDDWKLVAIILFVALLLNGALHKKHDLTQWLIISLVATFVAYNDALFAVALLFYLAITYALRRMVSTARNRNLLSLVLLTTIFFLLLFKYNKDGIEKIFANPGGFDLLMPIGVSYFVIRILDTQLKWYRQEALDFSFREYLFFILFPGTLIAGPIEDIKHFYTNRVEQLKVDDISYGLSRILIGVFKKIVIADGFLYGMMQGKHFSEALWSSSGNPVNLLVADPAVASGADIFTFSLLGLLFAYIDFSAYSDIAIGLSRMFGYRIRENFNFPIFAVNIREYWKRWHMSLSDWSFRNVYFPALIKTQNSYLPLYVTMLSIGFWHAFNLSWFSWAIHHATGMVAVDIANRHWKPGSRLKRMLAPVRVSATVLYATMGFIFVFFSDYSIAITLYKNYWEWIFSWAASS